MDFVSDSLGTGRRIRILTVLDLWGRSNPALKVDISLSSQRVVQVLERLCLQGRLPRRVHTDNGPEFMGRALDEWAREHGVDMEYSRPGKPTDNGFVESFNERERERRHSRPPLPRLKGLPDNRMIITNSRRAQEAVLPSARIRHWMNYRPKGMSAIPFADIPALAMPLPGPYNPR